MTGQELKKLKDNLWHSADMLRASAEKENAKMDGVLPKEVYGQLVPEEEPELLSKIIRVFKDIPEDISIDLFGEIYEYFLGEFVLV